MDFQLSKKCDKKRKKHQRREHAAQQRAMYGEKRKYWNALGKFNAFRYRFSLNFYSILEAGLIAMTLLGLTLNYWGKSDFSVFITLSFLISLLVPIVRQLSQYIRLKKEVRLFTEFENERTAQTKALDLHPEYIASGYQSFVYHDGKTDIGYIMSARVNEHLNQYELGMNYHRSKFIMPFDLRKYIGFSLKKVLNGESYVFNGREVKQISDIYTDTTLIETQKTDYFTNIATNEMVYKKIKNNTKIGEIFYGNVLAEEELGDTGRKVWRNLSSSQCANIIGINTLAITRDSYLIVNVQGSKSFVSSGCFVPSGSGSADYRKLKKGASFNAFLEQEMERELFEEVNLKHGTRTMTDVCGYARLVEKGGKPDFFGISYVDENYLGGKDCIQSRIKSSGEIATNLMDTPFVCPLNDTKLSSVLAKLDEFCNPKSSEDRKIQKMRSSVQLAIMRNILEQYQANGREIYDELKSRFENRKKAILFSKGSTNKNEDLVNCNNGFYWILDGATPLCNAKVKGSASDAVFLVERWNHFMMKETNARERPLREIIESVYQSVKQEYDGLTGGFAVDATSAEVPSMGAVFINLNAAKPEIITFGDVQAFIKTTKGIVKFDVSQLRELDNNAIAAMETFIQDEGLTHSQAKERDAVKALLRDNRNKINKPDGYCAIVLCEKTLSGKGHVEESEDKIEAILAMTDGFYDNRVMKKFAYHGTKESVTDRISDQKKFKVLDSQEKMQKIYRRIRKTCLRDVNCKRQHRLKVLDDASALLIDLTKK